MMRLALQGIWHLRGDFSLLAGKKPKKSAARKKNNKGGKSGKNTKKPAYRRPPEKQVSPLEQERRRAKRQKAAEHDLSEIARMPGEVIVPQDDGASGWTEKKLADTFNAKNWVGKTDEMKKLWKDVPRDLRDSFDFAAAYSKARRLTLEQKAPPKDFGPQK
jgi:hypothetical protein